MENEQRRQTASEEDLLASGIHEVRRPLTLVRGYLEMLSEESLGELNQHQRRTLQRIEEKLREARELLEGLNKFARFQRRRERLALEMEVRRAMHRAAAKAELRAGAIRARLVPMAALGNRTLVARILDNLLDNALTYSEMAPEVTVEVGQQNRRPFVRVSDRGFGLSPGGATALFSASFRDRPGDRTHPDAGLGLYLSRRAAEEMGGSLLLERNAPGEGATFRLNLRPAG